MAKGDFLWCDLSTFRLTETKAFYTRLLGWSYQVQAQPDGSPYHIGATRRGDAAAVFEMPQKFQEMGLPSFWMSYIAVDDIARTVDLARQLGGKVEMGPIPFGDGASVALVRDPLGAGFTLYQGSDLAPRAADGPPGHMAWNALYVSDAGKVTEFYGSLFDWRFSEHPASPGTLRVFNAGGAEISEIHELPEDIRGKFQFWGVHFAVADLPAAKARVAEGGGKILYEMSAPGEAPGEAPREAPGEATLLAQDPDGAAFFLTAATGAAARREAPSAADPNGIRWKTMLALVVIWVAAVLEVNWVWGVLFIMWTIPAIRSGQTFFVEPVGRHRHAVLFWLIVGTWIVLSLYLIAVDLWPLTAGWG